MQPSEMDMDENLFRGYLTLLLYGGVNITPLPKNANYSLK